MSEGVSQTPEASSVVVKDTQTKELQEDDKSGVRHHNEPTPDDLDAVAILAMMTELPAGHNDVRSGGDAGQTKARGADKEGGGSSKQAGGSKQEAGGAAKFELGSCSPRSVGGRTKRTVTLEQIWEVLHLPEGVAATRLNMSLTYFKKYVKANGIVHWPYRQVCALAHRHQYDPETYVVQFPEVIGRLIASSEATARPAQKSAKAASSAVKPSV